MGKKIIAINSTERKIIKDPYFKICLEIGNVIPGHPEGKLKNHLEDMLNYLDKKYPCIEDYQNVRLLILLHDIGKLGKLSREQDEYVQEALSKKKKEFLIKKGDEFWKKYDYNPKIKNEYIPKHALYSEMFAKKFIKNKRLLLIIRYHDTAYRFFLQNKKNAQYDQKTFKNIFSKVDCKLFLIFREIDNCRRPKTDLNWTKKQFEKHKLI